MKIAKGTVLELATPTGTKITLESDAVISFPGSEVHDTKVGFLQVTNNWEANAPLYKFNRDANGNLLPLIEQPKDGQSVEEFTKSLTKPERELFGITD